MSDRDRRLAALLGVVPLLFAVPVLWGISVSVVHLLGTPHVDLGWATAVNSDAEAVYLGVPLHEDPAKGYTGQMYTPLFPVIIGILDHVVFWTAWPLLLSIGASLSLVALTARVAFVDPRGAWPLRSLTAVGAIGIGALGWWLVSALHLPVLYEGRSDQLAWAFAIGGVVATACISRDSRTTISLSAIALLSLAVWTKQNTIGAAVAATLWLLLRSLAGELPIRRTAAFAAGLAAVNLAVLAVLNLVSAGWEWRLNFGMPSDHSVSRGWTPWVTQGLTSAGPALGFCVAMGLAATVALAPRRPPHIRKLLACGGRRRRVAEALVLFAAVAFVFGVYFRRKQGTSDNQFIGFTWAVVLLGAVWFAVAQRVRRGAIASAAIVTAGFVLALLPGFERFANRHSASVPPLKPAMTWPEVPQDVRDYSGGHLVYHTTWSDLNVRRQHVLYPNYFNIADLLAAGRQPKYLIRAFLDRRFDAVLPFPPVDIYTSGYGKWEDNYLWKLNAVIAARYVAAPGVPAGMLARRPGPEVARWMRTCFGPFAAGGARWRIGHGGGFWCQASANQAITMRETPAPETEMRTTETVQRVEGRLRLRLPTGWAELRAAQGAHSWALRAEAGTRGAVRFTVLRDGRPTARATAIAAQDGTVQATITQRGESLRTASGARFAVPAGDAEMSLVTAAGSGLVVDLGGLRIR